MDCKSVLKKHAGSNPALPTKFMFFDSLNLRILVKRPMRKGNLGSIPSQRAKVVNGNVAEWFIALVLKTRRSEMGAWVRTPPFPPKFNLSSSGLGNLGCVSDKTWVRIP
jgi:hypothetical protein